MNMMKLTSNWPTHWIDDYDKTDLELTHQMLINWPWIDPPKPSENCKGEIGLRDAGGAETNCKLFVIMMTMMTITIYPNNDEEWSWQLTIYQIDAGDNLSDEQMMQMMTSDRTNDVCDKEGKQLKLFVIMMMRFMMTIYPIMLMTSDPTNDVGDKEGKPADDEDAHHGSQSLCSFCLFWNPFHDYHHGDDDGDKKRGKVPYKKLEFPAKIRNNPNFDKKKSFL